MKQRFLEWLRQLILKTVRFFQYLAALLEKQQLSEVYHSLSPVDKADDDNHYFNALFWALTTRGKNNIRNIALTGPYGSGKSSVLKSFQKKYIGRDLHFLNISLATFKEESEKQKSIPEQELLRLIEISILQQIFYHEQDENIPDSRFKKIKSYGRLKLLITAVLVWLTIIAGIDFFYPDFIQSIFKDYTFSERAKGYIFYITRVFLAVAFITALVRSIRVLSSITINKLKVQDAEIGLANSASKSVLNNHLDEILYFFEVTKYNVVIIEDLDRFRETEIFTKLREINNLLNSSKKTGKKEITFIYAVRDDMFKDKDRTKFFDFIVPVIPVINSSNSGEKMLAKKTAHKYDISESFIDTISFFIDDMRLLHNVMNEFFLYKQKLEPRLNNEKLLALLVYKNIYPNDFTLLSQNTGVLYKSIKEKKNYLATIVNEADLQVKTIKAEIANLETIGIANVQDLNRLYVLAAVQSLTQFNTFSLNGKELSPDELSVSDNFNNLIKGTVQYKRWFVVHYNQLIATDTVLNFKFSDLEKSVHSKTYNARKKEVEDVTNGRIEKLKQQIAEIENKKTVARHAKIKDILKEGLVKIENANITADHVELIRVLLTNGFVSEDYLDYISIFYEGSISRADHQFMVCVKTQRRLDYDYPLNNIANLIAKLDIADFYSEYVWNFDLLDHILNKRLSNQLNGFLNTLGDSSASALNFTDKFVLEHEASGALLVKELVRGNVKFWFNVENNENFSNERRLFYLKLITETIAIERIKMLADVSKLKIFIAKNASFLFCSEKKDRVLAVLRLLRPDIETIDFENTHPELIEYLLTNNDYEISIHNIKGFLKFRGKLEEEKFERANFTAILDSGIGELIELITENATVYVRDVLLNLKTSDSETQAAFLNLLNNKELEEVDLTLVIKQQRTRIESITEVERAEIRKILLNESKVLPTWENLFFDIDVENSLSIETASAFVNIYDNAVQLSQDSLDDDAIEKYKALISSDKIGIESYKLILEANRWIFDDLPLASLERKKVHALIAQEVLEFNKNNLDALRTSHPGLIPDFLIVNKSDFPGNIKSVDLNGSEVISLLSSSDLTVTEKSTIIKDLSEDVIVSSQVTDAVLQLHFKDSKFEIPAAVVKKFLLTNMVPLTTQAKISLFTRYNKDLTESEVSSFLEILGAPYTEFLPSGRRPLIDASQEVEKMLAILLARGYISSYKHEKDSIRVVTQPKT